MSVTHMQDWRTQPLAGPDIEEDAPRKRRTDLTPYLNGTYSPPMPSVGGYRDDGVRLLYPERWHSVVALNAAGKSWFAVWHVVQVLRDGGTVVYAHFEESLPVGTLARIRSIAPDLTVDQLAERFVWLDCSASWEVGEFAASLPAGPALVVLDGINAACGQHGWDVNAPEAVGAYRRRFVTPAVKAGAAVLSLGHPPKAKDRQGERHGFGSTAWLDEVDGVGFRLEAAKASPIRKGHRGYSALYSVKDRYGEVEQRGELEQGRDAGWYYHGAFTLDDSLERVTNGNPVAFLSAPKRDDQGHQPDGIDRLGVAIVEYLESHGRQFDTRNSLIDGLRAARVQFTAGDVAPALERLAAAGRIEWPDVIGRGKPRPGWLTDEDGSDTEDG